MSSDPSRTDEPSATETDGGPGFDREALYRTVRQAVQDAILDAIGTVLLVAVGSGLAIVGGSFLVRMAFETGVSAPALALGVWLVVIGFYVVASTLDVIQPVRDWF